MRDWGFERVMLVSIDAMEVNESGQILTWEKKQSLE